MEVPPELSPARSDLSVIIVNYNVRAFLEQTLRSVRRAKADLDVEVLVVDNNSVDGSCDMVRERFPEVRLIENKENVGFARANNQAIRESSGRFLLILNPDTIVQEDTFEVLVRFMEMHPAAGAVGPTILHPDGSFALVSRRSFPTPTVAFYRMIGLSRLFPGSPRFGRYNMTFLPEDETAEVDALCGCCMMVRREALLTARTPDAGSRIDREGAGLLDEDYFMYGEDLEWCYSFQQAGWNVYYTPETRIIHYKGESTKKGELRYVRLFYRAMLQFVDKHFQGRYSRVFSWLLRAGIFTRATLAVLQRWARAATAPLLDLALVAVAVSVMATGYGAVMDQPSGPGFFLTVVPAYALTTVLGIYAMKGYRRNRRHRVRPAAAGVAGAFLVVSAISFFIKRIAFSRAIVGLSFPLALVLLAGWRLWTRRKETGIPRVLLVGRAEEMRRLEELLRQHPRPPMAMIGYVAPHDTEENGNSSDASPQPHPPLGRLSQLRDLVRLRDVDEVLFGAEGLSNHLLFRLVQQLRDLPVQVKILAEERSHVIGKAAIYDLAAPAFLEAEEAVGLGRSRLTQRAWEVLVALVGLILHPFLLAAARLTGTQRLPARLAARTRQLPAVLSGRKALVGTDPRAPVQPPEEWGLRPGVFTITEGLGRPPQPSQAQRAYWHYLTHASAALDWHIIRRALLQ